MRFRRKPKPEKEFPYLNAPYKRGTDYQPAPAVRVEIEVPEGYLNPNLSHERFADEFVEHFPKCEAG